MQRVDRDEDGQIIRRAFLNCKTVEDRVEAFWYLTNDMEYNDSDVRLILFGMGIGSDFEKLREIDGK